MLGCRYNLACLSKPLKVTLTITKNRKLDTSFFDHYQSVIFYNKGRIHNAPFSSNCPNKLVLLHSKSFQPIGPFVSCEENEVLCIVSACKIYHASAILSEPIQQLVASLARHYH